MHPVYVYAGPQGYLTRFSCRVCIFMSRADLKGVYENDREAFDLVAQLEQHIGFTMRHGQSLYQIVVPPYIAQLELSLGAKEKRRECR